MDQLTQAQPDQEKIDRLERQKVILSAKIKRLLQAKQATETELNRLRKPSE